MEGNDSLGHGLKQLYLEDDRHKGGTLRKLLQYELLGDGTIKLELNPQYSYKSGFICIKKPYLINATDWINFDDRVTTGQPLTRFMIQRRMSIIWRSIIHIVRGMFNHNNNQEKINLLQKLFIQELFDDNISISILIGFSTFYRNFMDSHFRSVNPTKKFHDLVWTRTLTHDNVMNMNLILLIDGLHNSDRLNGYLQTNFTNNFQSVLLLIGTLFRSVQRNQSLNYELYDIDNVPVLTDSYEPICISAERAIQQLYGAHDHIVPSRHDTIGLIQNISSYPSIIQSHFEEYRSAIIPPYLHDPVGFCGVVFICFCKPPVPNCPLCRNQKKRGGIIIAHCCENAWPFVRCYSIHQGYLSRFANADCINEVNY